MSAKNEWYDWSEEIFGVLVLTHGVTKENAIFGKYGEIFQVNSTICKARIWSRTGVPKTYALKKIRKGEELVIAFPADDILLFIKALKVPRLVSSQLSLALEDKIERRTYRG